MTAPRTDTTRRVSYLTVTFDRIGPVPPARTRKPVPTLPPLTVHIPYNKGGRTAEHVDAMIAYLTLPVREYVRMSPHVPETFTVTIDLNGNGDGSVLVNGGRHGVGRIAETHP
jgi:hypothetical protein